MKPRFAAFLRSTITWALLKVLACFATRLLTRIITSLFDATGLEVAGAYAGAYSLRCWLFGPAWDVPAFCADAAVSGLWVLALDAVPALVEC
jgi:hypothetical protein